MIHVCIITLSCYVIWVCVGALCTSIVVALRYVRCFLVLLLGCALFGADLFGLGLGF